MQIIENLILYKNLCKTIWSKSPYSKESFKFQTIQDFPQIIPPPKANAKSTIS